MAGRPRDEAARRKVLRRAVDIASVEGLEGLTIGRLATDLGISKSGLFGYFGSKEELQLATIRAAARIFLDEVVEPALAVPPGAARVHELCERWLSYSERRVFPGGCFFYAANAEFNARSGRVRDTLATAARDWYDLFARTLADARQLGELAPDTDPQQLAFELGAFMENANAWSLLHGDPGAYRLARTAVARHLRLAAATPAAAAS
jgi:AcrR family transcriptional regulator